MRATPRAPLPARLLGLVLLAFLCTVTLEVPTPRLAAQPAKKKVEEEEEEMPNPPRSKAPIRVDDEPAPKNLPRREELPNVNLLEEGRLTGSPSLRAFYFNLAVPYDLLVTTSGERYKVRPVPENELPRDELTYFEFNAKMTAGINRKLAVEGIKELTPYEDIVVRDCERLLGNRGSDTTRIDQLEATVKAMAFAIRFHQSALESRGRTGKGWEPVLDRLRKAHQRQLRDFFLALAEAKQWDRAEQFAGQLAGQLPDDPEIQRVVYRLQLQKAEQTLAGGTEADFVSLKDALTQYEKTLTSRDLLSETVRKRLRDKAGDLVARAGKLAGENQIAAAQGRLRVAEALDADAPGLSELKGRLKDRILYVGVSRLPERLSPATARLDSERWAVELLFESLVQTVPDAELGRRFRPVLADGMPRVQSLAREFQLVRGARWPAGSGADPVDARDVRGTLKLLQKRPELPGGDGLELFEGVDRIDDPLHLRLTFKQGILEPLQRLNFKILPTQYLLKNQMEVDDERFSRAPIGSGPYRYEGREKEGPDRECAVFRANPLYQQRPGTFGLPLIREIRFAVPRYSGLAAEFQSGQMHLLLDLPTRDFLRLKGDPGFEKFARGSTLQANRRIWTLALNHRKPVFQSTELRRGIGLAIDREAILNEVFRVEGAAHHQALLGPFPAKSWATPPKAQSLHQPELARGECSKFIDKNRRLQVSLKYAAEDNSASVACQRIKAMVERAVGDTCEIFLQPMPITELVKNVEIDHDFEMAYYPYDFTDALFRLDGLLDPQASGRGGRNFLGYLTDNTATTDRDRRLRQALQDLQQHRDFTRTVRERTWEVHQLFVQQMPFVPLWQLDRHVLVANPLEITLDDPRAVAPPALLDAATLFGGVENWRIK